MSDGDLPAILIRLVGAVSSLDQPTLRIPGPVWLNPCAPPGHFVALRTRKANYS